MNTMAWFLVPAAILAVGVAAWGRARGATTAGAWFALGIAGQAASLVLWKAGPLVGYQHLQPTPVTAA